MSTLTVDFITSLDGYASAGGWPGLWGIDSPDYIEWLDQQPAATFLLGAKTYRLMHGMATGTYPDGMDDIPDQEQSAFDKLGLANKVVFSSTLDEPLTWSNATLIRGDAAETVRSLKDSADMPLRTIGSLSLCRSLLVAGLVDRFRVISFPVITGANGSERIYDGYPDIMFDEIEQRTFQGGLQLIEFTPRILDHPPLFDS